MKLKTKTFTYSLIMGLVIMGLILGYMILMLPSLYVAYQEEKTKDEIVDNHHYFVQHLNYTNLENKMMQSDISIHYNGKTNKVDISNTYFNAKVLIKDEKLIELLTLLKDEEVEGDKDSVDMEKEVEETFDEILERLKGDGSFLESTFSVEEYTYREESNVKTQVTVEAISTNTVLMISKAQVDQDTYVSYYAMSRFDDDLYITIAPRIQSNVTDILPIVARSIPTLLVITILLLLIVSQIYARSIINPILKISRYMKKARNSKREVPPPQLKNKDEIGQLRDELEKLYMELRASYQELERKSKGKELFLRSSSHNLKTPISSVLLLIDSLEHGVGKYGDKDVALPEIKSQIKYIEKIINDITYFNNILVHPDLKRVEIYPLVENIVNSKRLMIEEKRLQFNMSGETEFVVDIDMFKAALENLIINAIHYTEDHGEITIHLSEDEIQIVNSPSQIDEKLIDNIKEPFVSESKNMSKSGLGLYIADYYFQLLNLQMTIENGKNSVTARIKKESK